jgi:transposase InsO family protein
LQVSKSGYYDWCSRQEAPPTIAKKRQQERHQHIEKIFRDSRYIYGYRKIQAALRRQGISGSHNTIHKDCQQLGIKSISKRKYRISTTDSNHDLPIASNVLNRDFKADKPNEKWETDITYVATVEGWLYLV